MMSQGTVRYIEDRFARLFEVLDELGVDSYIIPIAKKNNMDARLPGHMFVEWLSGFSGDFGVLLASRRELVFFVNSINKLQAQRELGYFDHIVEYHVTPPHQWMIENASRAKINRVGYSGDLWSVSVLSKYKKAFDGRLELVLLPYNPVEHIWTDRPKTTHSSIVSHNVDYCGVIAGDKLSLVTQRFEQDYLLLSAADSIAWLLNARGHDTPFAPLFFAEMLVPRSAESISECVLFADHHNVDIAHSPKIEKTIALTDHIKSIACSGFSIGYDPKFTSVDIKNALDSSAVQSYEIEDPCQSIKSIKNEVEVSGFRASHIRDAVAVIEFMHWFDQNHQNGLLTELSCVEALNAFRQKQDLFQFNSFPPIIGFNSNSAIIHYHPSEVTNARIEGDGVLLVDSGGHYLDGTTDITRTIAVGTPSEYQRAAYTHVLKGHLALQMMVFPKQRLPESFLELPSSFCGAIVWIAFMASVMG